MSSFDDVSVKPQQSPIKPLFTIKTGDEKELHKWVKNAYEVILDKEQDRHEQVSHNFRLYKGAQRVLKEARPRTQEVDTPMRRRERLEVNYLFDITEDQISRITRYKPAVSIEPADSDEFEGKIDASVAKKFLDEIWYRVRIDRYMTRLHRRSRVAGEDYLYVYWDPDEGDEHPEYQKAKASGEPIPLLDEKGEQLKDDSGQPRHIEGAVKTGEVCYKLLSTRQVLCQPAVQEWPELDYVLIIEERDIDKTKKQFKGKEDKIKAATVEMAGLTSDKLKDLEIKNLCLTITLIHKPTKELPQGLVAVCTMDGVLDKRPFPYKHGRLPLVRLTDIDDEDGGLHGQSYFLNIEGLQHQYNNLSSMILQNQALCSYPKWMMPKGAADIQSLSNERTIVQFKGSVAPVLVQANPTPAEVFNFREGIKSEMKQLGGGSQQDRGEPPPGIKAGVALQYLNEQVEERFNTYVQKHNEVIIEIARLTLETMGQYYQDDEGRIERIVGKKNADALRRYSVKNLAKDFNVRIQNASALPDSKAARTQTIIDLKGAFPDLFTSAQVVDLLELGNTQKLNDAVTAAIKSAESENEDLRQGIPVDEPAEYEDHIEHWRIHTLAMQDRTFKALPPEIQQAHKDHVLATEMLMYMQAQKTPAFAAKLQAFPLFPMLYNPDGIETGTVNPNAAPPPPGAAGGGGAPLGASPPVQSPNPEMPMNAAPPPLPPQGPPVGSANAA